jgi:hypothetical protein
MVNKTKKRTFRKKNKKGGIYDEAALQEEIKELILAKQQAEEEEKKRNLHRFRRTTRYIDGNNPAIRKIRQELKQEEEKDLSNLQEEIKHTNRMAKMIEEIHNIKLKTKEDNLNSENLEYDIFRNIMLKDYYELPFFLEKIENKEIQKKYIKEFDVFCKKNSGKTQWNKDKKRFRCYRGLDSFYMNSNNLDDWEKVSSAIKGGKKKKQKLTLKKIKKNKNKKSRKRL